MWVFFAALALVAVLAGAVGWFIANSRPTAVVVIPRTVPTSTVETSTTTATTATVPATTTVEATTSPPAVKPKTTKEWAFLTGGSINGGKLYIKADYIYFYPAGAAAEKAHAKYGGSLRDDFSYVRNLSTAVKTLMLKPNANVQLIEWLETGTAGSSFKYGKADPTAFVSVLAGYASSPSGVWSSADKAVLLTVTGSSVSAVTQYQSWLQ
jgi:hypothetical protein